MSVPVDNSFISICKYLTSYSGNFYLPPRMNEALCSTFTIHPSLLLQQYAYLASPFFLFFPPFSLFPFFPLKIFTKKRIILFRIIDNSSVFLNFYLFIYFYPPFFLFPFSFFKL